MSKALDPLGAAAVLLIKSDDKYYLALSQESDKRWNILGYKSAVEGVRSIEDMYNSNHRRGYEASMSACIHGITFQHSIVFYESVAKLAETLGLTGKEKVTHIRNVSGGYDTIALDKAKAAPEWERGDKPRLIS